MNAHINLDLGVTASELGDGGAIDAVRADFDAVNDVLGELVDGCQGALGQVSPWLGLADRDRRVGRRDADPLQPRGRPPPGVVRRRAARAAGGRRARAGDRRRRCRPRRGSARAVEHPGLAGERRAAARAAPRAQPRRPTSCACWPRVRPPTLGEATATDAAPGRSAIREMAAVTKRSTEQLQAGLDHVRAAPIGRGRLEMIVRRPALDEREVLESAELDLDVGLVGDTWQRRSTRTADGSPHPHMQVTLMNARAAALIAGSGPTGRSPATSSTSTCTSAPRSCRPAPSCGSATRRRRGHRPAPPWLRQVHPPLRPRRHALRELRGRRAAQPARHQRQGRRARHDHRPATPSSASTRSSPRT